MLDRLRHRGEHEDGSAGLRAHARVAAMTTRRLLPGESEAFRVRIPLSLSPGTPMDVWLTVNTGAARVPLLRECREDNNTTRYELYCPELG